MLNPQQERLYTMLGYIFVPEGKTLKKARPYKEFVGPVIVTHHRNLHADPKFTDGTDYDIHNNKEDAEYLLQEDLEKNKQFKQDQISIAREALKAAEEEIKQEEVAEEEEEEEVVICDECDNDLEDCPCDE